MSELDKIATVKKCKRGYPKTQSTQPSPSQQFCELQVCPGLLPDCVHWPLSQAELGTHPGPVQQDCELQVSLPLPKTHCPLLHVCPLIQPGEPGTQHVAVVQVLPRGPETH